jgi:hypothetical protein
VRGFSSAPARTSHTHFCSGRRPHAHPHKFSILKKKKILAKNGHFFQKKSKKLFLAKNGRACTRTRTIFPKKSEKE